MNTDKKLALLANEFNATIDHATDVLEEYANTLTEKILVDAFNELSEEDQMLVLMGLLWETKPEVKENKTVFDFDFAVEHNLDYEAWETLQRLESICNNPHYSYDTKVIIEALMRMEGIKL